MANRNECFSDFSRQRTAKERWYSLVPEWVTVWNISRRPSPSPRVCTDVRSLARSLARSYADVITKFSRLYGLPIFLTHGASLARFARWSSAMITELETLWNFVHVAFLKLRMSTSEIHRNSLHVSKLRTYSFTMEIIQTYNFNLKLASPYHIHIHEHVRREKDYNNEMKKLDSIIKEHKNRIVLIPLSLFIK